MRQWSELIEKCDALIRAGRSAEAVHLLSGINTAQVPRESRLPLAKICRRSGLYMLGMRLLNASLEIDPTPQELAEFAVLLLRHGGVNEALERLYEIEGHDVPEVLLYRAFGHFGRWEYDEAIPQLKQYLSSPLAPYAQLVGQTNLVFALVEARQHEAAQELLKTLIPTLSRQGHLQLQSNCHALAGQVYLQEGDYLSARKEIESADSLIRQTQTNDRFLVTKMNLILDSLEKNTLTPLEKLRSLATERRDWAALREADLFSLKVKFDQQCFVHLFFGTPYEGFRKTIKNELGQLPDRSIYVLGSKKAPRFDIEAGTIDDIEISSAGGKCHQLIEILLRDFYEPSRVPGLFAALFPGERFNVLSSPDRVHQLILRTRRWLKTQKIPVSLVESEGFYSLRIDGDFSFRIPLERRTITSEMINYKKLDKYFRPSPSFTAKEAAEKLGLSLASVQRLLNASIESGSILKLGSSKRSTAYKLK